MDVTTVVKSVAEEKCTGKKSFRVLVSFSFGTQLLSFAIHRLVLVAGGQIWHTVYEPQAAFIARPFPKGHDLLLQLAYDPSIPRLTTREVEALDLITRYDQGLNAYQFSLVPEGIRLSQVTN
jgi:hypothetical protein